MSLSSIQSMPSVNVVSGYSKWKDPDFIRKYQREQKRIKSVIKRHPNILPDGRKWSDVHPHGRFETREEKLQNQKKYYTRSPKETCLYCGVDYYTSMKEKHFNSKKHCNAIQTLALHGLHVMPVS